MREVLICNLSTKVQSVFFHCPSSPSYEPRRTARHGSRHQPSVESEAHRYMSRVDSPATGRGNSSDVPSRCGGLTGGSQESFARRAHPSMDVDEGETRYQTGLQSLSDSVYQLDRLTREVRDEVAHEGERRLELQDFMKSSPRNGRRIRPGSVLSSLRMSGHNVLSATS